MNGGLADSFRLNELRLRVLVVLRPGMSIFRTGSQEISKLAHFSVVHRLSQQGDVTVGVAVDLV